MLCDGETVLPHRNRSLETFYIDWKKEVDCGVRTECLPEREGENDSCTKLLSVRDYGSSTATPNNRFESKDNLES